jgi:hypothetical protein
MLGTLKTMRIGFLALDTLLYIAIIVVVAVVFFVFTDAVKVVDVAVAGVSFMGSVGIALSDLDKK